MRYKEIFRLMAFALVPIVGFAGLLLVDGLWEPLFLAIAFLPLIVGGGLAMLRNKN